MLFVNIRSYFFSNIVESFILFSYFLLNQVDNCYNCYKSLNNRLSKFLFWYVFSEVGSIEQIFLLIELVYNSLISF